MSGTPSSERRSVERHFDPKIPCAKIIIPQHSTPKTARSSLEFSYDGAVNVTAFVFQYEYETAKFVSLTRVVAGSPPDDNIFYGELATLLCGGSLAAAHHIDYFPGHISSRPMSWHFPRRWSSVTTAHRRPFWTVAGRPSVRARTCPPARYGWRRIRLCVCVYMCARRACTVVSLALARHGTNVYVERTAVAGVVRARVYTCACVCVCVWWQTLAHRSREFIAYSVANADNAFVHVIIIFK